MLHKFLLFAALCLSACAAAAVSLPDRSGFPPTANPESSGLSLSPDGPMAVEFPDQEPLSTRQAAVKDQMDNTQWTEWEFYAKEMFSFPARAYFEGTASSSERDDFEVSIYIRKNVANPTKWQVRLDNIYGDVSMLLNYDYDTKRFNFVGNSVVTTIPVSQVWLDGMSDDFQPNETIRIIDKYEPDNSFTDYSKYGNFFYPEAGEIWFGNFFFSFATGKDGTKAEHMIYGFQWNYGHLSARRQDYTVLLDCGTPRHFTSSEAETVPIIATVGSKVRSLRLIIFSHRSQFILPANPFRITKEDFQLPGCSIMDVAITGDETIISPLNLPVGTYSVMVLVIDDSGLPVYTPYTYSMAFNTKDSRNWKPLGKGMLQDRTLFKYHTDVPPEVNYWDDYFFNDDWSLKVDNPSWEVDVEEAVDFPGIYRIKNPYINHPDRENIYLVYECGFEPEKSDDYYIYVDATDPDMVVFEPSFDGVGGSMLIGPIRNTYAYYYKGYENGELSFGHENLSNLCGRMEDGKIIFPLFTVSRGVGWLDDPYPDVSQTGGNYTNPDWMLILPEASAATVEDDGSEEPAVYYNLQGMPVIAPIPGEIVIEKRGSSVSKLLAH